MLLSNKLKTIATPTHHSLNLATAQKHLETISCDQRWPIVACCMLWICMNNTLQHMFGFLACGYVFKQHQWHLGFLATLRDP
jgi:hypothetical protein